MRSGYLPGCPFPSVAARRGARKPSPTKATGAVRFRPNSPSEREIRSIKSQPNANLFTGVLETCVTASLASFILLSASWQKGNDLIAVASICHLLYPIVHIRICGRFGPVIEITSR
jgi:hypothetical protein